MKTLTIVLVIVQAWLLYRPVPPGGIFYVYTDPPGARVYKRELSLDGYRDRLIPGLTPGPVNTRPFQGVLLIRLDGFADEKIPAERIDFEGGRYPAEGAVKLVPLSPFSSWWILLKTWWPTLALLSAWALDYRRRLERRAGRAEEEARAQRFAAGIVEQGTRIDRYVVQRELGAGGMARVYEVLQPDGSRAALKLLSEGSTERFRREAEVMRGLLHPNLVPLYDYGDFDGRFYLVMELVGGTTLDRSPVRSEISRWAPGVASALRCLHERNLVHRDVKASNVMIRDDGRPLLMDLGIARPEGGSQLTAQGQIVGTPGMMAPEQIAGEDLDFRADLYSFGVLLYQCLTGRLPFQGETALELIASQLKDDPVPIEQLRPDLDPELIALVGRLLSRDAAQRAAAPDQLQRELEAL